MPTPPSDTLATLAAENAELKIRLLEYEETIQAIHSGEVDALVVNDELFTLESVQAAGSRLRQEVLDQMEEAVFAFDEEEHLVYLNASAETRYDVRASEVMGCKVDQLFEESHIRDLPRAADAGGEAGAARPRTLSSHRLRNGRMLQVESSRSVLTGGDGEPVGYLLVFRDVTRRTEAEQRRDGLARLVEALRDLDDADEVAYRAACTLGEVLQVGRAGFALVDADTDTLRADRQWAAPGLDGLPRSACLRDYGSFVADLRRGEVVRIADVARDERTRDFLPAFARVAVQSVVQVPIVERGRLVALVFANDRRAREWDDDEVAFVRDVADRAQASVERARASAALRESESRLRALNENLEAAVVARTAELVEAQAALRQSQKMEAVGQLTGGIAHDFNNLLGGMSAALQMLQLRLKAGRLDDVDRYLGMSQNAIRRAAALTQRLLAFARRQTLDPKPTDVNRLIGGLEELIQRTVGPDVTLNVAAGDGLWPTKVDPSQLENSLLNLCINARDAMAPAGGLLTIDTANRVLDARMASERGLPAGAYIVISVTDTGAGMTDEVKERIFDPFFTTKPLGQGTGLGLSMVYGFVRQSGGQIGVESAVGTGTTMSLYLPRHVGEAPAEDVNAGVALAGGGDGRIILLIEDEETIRKLVAELLVDAGYRVATADDGPSGMRLLETAKHIDLLITDVGLPGGMNGRQVADAARVQRTGLKVLFITGYAENATVGAGHLEPGMAVLGKPFDLATLTQKVKEMIG